MLSAGIVLAINLIAQIIKDKIQPRYGQTGVHVFIFLLALFFVLGKALIYGTPSLLALFEQAMGLLGASIATYEILWKQIGSAVNINVLND